MQNRDALAGRSVWLFSVSSLGDRHAVAPRDHRKFTGAIERTHWPVFGRVVFRQLGCRFGDHRDWPDIESWAAEIDTQL